MAQTTILSGGHAHPRKCMEPIQNLSPRLTTTMATSLLQVLAVQLAGNAANCSLNLWAHTRYVLYITAIVWST